MGNVWLCKPKELALCCNEDSTALTNCGQTLIVTDQGYEIADRLGSSNNFYLDSPGALTRAGGIFNAASSALAALVSMDDDKETHRVTATIPSPSAYPLRMEFVLANMNTEAGWTRHRPMGVWLSFRIPSDDGRRSDPFEDHS
ncbi:hypothetical protein GCK32_001209 [Trichostrongylus colubriformis]|uniref:Uncharacterized protein n=1 Tax=Trichostrongylus colubriformis TaxID=6319 RepID=A0AAN8IP85_TRICO